jgi:hypothetical protein
MDILWPVLMIICGTNGMIIDMEKLKYLEKNLPPPPRHFIHHKSLMDYPDIELWPLQLEAWPWR